MTIPHLARLFADSESAEHYVSGVLDRVVELHRRVDRARVAGWIERIEAAVERHATIFLMGNGGCSALASHWVDDLATSGRRLTPPVRALSLTDNVPSLTCIANDSGFEQVFSDQLRQHMRSGDVVIALSVSGNSPNLVEGFGYAKAHGAETLALCGFDGGWLGKHADHAIIIESSKDEFGPVQDVMSTVLHAISGYLSQSRGEGLAHS